jgi:hypothetical protein
MGLSDKYPSQITEQDLQSLILDREAEGKTFEYKRDVVGKVEADKKEFLYDVSSFANTNGGCLIFGMEEEKGYPSSLVGLENVNPDQEILRLEQMLRDGVRPPIIGVESAAIALNNGNVALVMRIPRSWNPPHQVIYQNAFRFYGRGTNGKYQLDVDELRSVFSISASAAERIKLFRIERIAKIVSGDTPVSLEAGGKMVVHLLPLSAFTSQQTFDVNKLYNDHSSLVGVLRRGGSPICNVDGVLLASPNRPASRYAQAFRNGCVEVVADWSAEANGGNFLPIAFEKNLIEHVYRGKQLFQSIGVSPPVVIMVTLLGMKGWRILMQYSESSAAAFDRDPMFIPELILQAFNGLVQNEVKPILDGIWNAAGSPQSPSYNREGQFVG